MRTVPIIDYLRRYGLAAACVFGPFLLVNFGTDFAVGMLVSHDKVKSLPPGLTYALQDPRKPDGSPDPAASASGASAKAAEKRPVDQAKSETEKKSEAELRSMEIYARHIAGRYNFSVGSGFVYLVSAIAALFAAVTIYRRV